MIKLLWQQTKSAWILLGIFSLLFGFIYPMIITFIAQVFFNFQANGSLIIRENKIIGSALIGQSFTSTDYFWGRPSATTPFPYNALNSSGSNLSASNPVFLTTIKERVLFLQQTDPHNEQPIPIDLVTASASGLDPDISLLAAFYQVPRIAKARHLNENDIKNIIQTFYQERTFKFLGEPRINVLVLNLALDTLGNHSNGKTP